MGQTSVSRNDIAVLQTVWADLHIKGEPPKPSQFAMWLRLYPIDIVSEGLQVGRRWLERTKSQPPDDFIRYVSAVMRNIQAGRALDAEAAE